MTRRGSVLLLCTLAILTTAAFVGAQAPAERPLPPPRSIPGVTAGDKYPNACVDCHVNMTDLKLDVRLSTLVREWTKAVPPALLAKAQASAPEGVTLKGQHPTLPQATFAKVPAGCLTCHSRTSRLAPPMARMLHTIHLTGGERNVFLTEYQGECTHCHKLDQSSGAWSLPTGAEK